MDLNFSVETGRRCNFLKWAKSDSGCGWCRGSVARHDNELSVGLKDMSSPQDGATTHKTVETIQLPKKRFPAHVISMEGVVNCAARFCETQMAKVQLYIRIKISKQFEQLLIWCRYWNIVSFIAFVQCSGTIVPHIILQLPSDKLTPYHSLSSFGLLCPFGIKACKI